MNAVDRAVSGPRRSTVEIHSGTWQHDLAQADFVTEAVGKDRIETEGLALRVVMHPVDSHRLALALEEGDELLPMVRKAYHEQLAAARGRRRRRRAAARDKRSRSSPARTRPRGLTPSA